MHLNCLPCFVADESSCTLRIYLQHQMQRVLGHLWHRIAAAAFRTWLDFKRTQQRQTSLLAKSLARMSNLTQSRSWEQWCAVVSAAQGKQLASKQVERLGQIVARVFHRCHSRSLALSLPQVLTGWERQAIRQLRRRGLTDHFVRCVKLRRQRQIVRAWEVWSTNRCRRRRYLTPVVRFLRKRQIDSLSRKIWLHWARGSVAHQRVEALLERRVVASLHALFGRWSLPLRRQHQIRQQLHTHAQFQAHRHSVSAHRSPAVRRKSTKRLERTEAGA